MSTFKKVNHDANQRGMNQVPTPSSKSTTKRVGVTGPISKPSPTTVNRAAVTPPHPKKGRPRQAEEATSPGTDSSNGGM